MNGSNLRSLLLVAVLGVLVSGCTPGAKICIQTWDNCKFDCEQEVPDICYIHVEALERCAAAGRGECGEERAAIARCQKEAGVPLPNCMLPCNDALSDCLDRDRER